MQVFGYPAYAHVDNSKLEHRSLKCIFLSYKAGVKGYKLWCPDLRKVIVSKDFVFDEIAILHDLPPTTSSDKTQQKYSL